MIFLRPGDDEFFHRLIAIGIPSIEQVQSSDFEVHLKRFVIGGFIISVYAACMATKTISIDMEAYEALRRARRSEKDSFSQVIKRAKWDEPSMSCGDLLAAIPHLPKIDEKTLRYWEKAQKQDQTPDDPWA